MASSISTAAVQMMANSIHLNSSSANDGQFYPSQQQPHKWWQIPSRRQQCKWWPIPSQQQQTIASSTWTAAIQMTANSISTAAVQTMANSISTAAVQMTANSISTAAVQMMANSISTAAVKMMANSIHLNSSGTNDGKFRLDDSNANHGQFHLNSSSTNDSQFHLNRSNTNDGQFHLYSSSTNDGQFHLNSSGTNDGQFHFNSSSANEGQFRLTWWRGSHCCSGACVVSASDFCESPAECHRDVPASRSLELLLEGALDLGVARSCCTAPCWRPRRSAPLSPRATQRRWWEARSQEAGLSGNKIMNVITLCNAQLSLAAADKSMILVSTNTTKHVFCRDKTRFVETKRLSRRTRFCRVCRQKNHTCGSSRQWYSTTDSNLELWRTKQKNKKISSRSRLQL